MVRSSVPSVGISNGFLRSQMWIRVVSDSNGKSLCLFNNQQMLTIKVDNHIESLLKEFIEDDSRGNH